MQKVSPLLPRLRQTTPPVLGVLLSITSRADAFREERGLCLKFHEDNHPFNHCRHPFIDASGCLIPKLGQLDKDPYRRWQARIICYRRDGQLSPPNNNKKNRLHHLVQSRGRHHDQGQINCHNDNTLTLDHHGGIPPTLASSSPAAALGMRFGAAQNPGGNPNARQPGTLRSGN